MAKAKVEIKKGDVFSDTSGYTLASGGNSGWYWEVISRGKQDTTLKLIKKNNIRGYSWSRNIGFEQTWLSEQFDVQVDKGTFVLIDDYIPGNKPHKCYDCKEMFGGALHFLCPKCRKLQ
jgi:hypothetical protein